MRVEAPLNKVIGQRLRALREDRRIPRERLALALEMSSENLRNYEAGKQKLTLSMLPTVAETYEMALTELLAELYGLGSTADTLGHSGDSSNNKSSANYDYTESVQSCFGPIRFNRSPIRELIAAGRYHQTLLETMKNVQCSLQCNAV